MDGEKEFRYQPRRLCTCEPHCRQLGHTSVFEADLARAGKRIDGPFAIEMYRQFMDDLTLSMEWASEDSADTLHRARTVRRIVFGVDAVPVDLRSHVEAIGGS